MKAWGKIQVLSGGSWAWHFSLWLVTAPNAVSHACVQFIQEEATQPRREIGVPASMLFLFLPATCLGLQPEPELTLKSLLHHLYSEAETGGLLFIDASQKAVEPSPRQGMLRTHLYSTGGRSMVD